jgi:hypothetical protein
MELLGQLYSLVMWYLRPLVKWFLRQTTRLCELQRICYGEPTGAPRTLAVEYSLASSRNLELQKLQKHIEKMLRDKELTAEETKGTLDSFLNKIMVVKNIKPDLHRQFVQSMTVCLKKIWGYKKLLKEVEQMRSIPYNEGDLNHEMWLLELWTLLQPDRPLDTRITKQWQDIGFQGEDPKTDFRGMGILGLQNLLYFAREYSSAAKHVLSHSHHPHFGYSFAIVGINLTHLAYKLLQQEVLRTHFYNICDGNPTIEDFHHFYSYLFVEFDKFWLECKPRDIMEFNRIRDLFENNVRSQLEDPRTSFKVNLLVETV